MVSLRRSTKSRIPNTRGNNFLVLFSLQGEAKSLYGFINDEILLIWSEFQTRILSKE